MKGLKGFTLIELMITIAVIALLVAIAYPAYQDQVRKGNRGAAQSFIMDVAQREQQMFLDQRSYEEVANQTTCAAANTAFNNALNMAVPPEVCNNYNLRVTVNAGPPPTFTIIATAKNNQVDDGNLTLDSQGNKTHNGNAGW